MDSQTRFSATRFIWAVLAVILCAVFIGAGMGSGLQNGHVVIAVAAIIAAGVSTGAIWSPGGVTVTDEGNEEDREKAKRERLDSVLRDLSNEDLIALKNRLADGSIDDDLLYERMTLSDDGELVPAERRS